METFSCGSIDPFFLNHGVYMAPFGIICVVIGVFLDYVIITQSKDLGTFKYYILNQAIWAQLYEFVIILMSPAIFNNCLGAVMTGFLMRSIGSYTLTQIVTVMAISLIGNTFVAVILCMVNRFLFVFTPSKRVYMDNKYTLSGVALFMVCYHSLVASAIYLSTTDDATARQLAINETGDSLIQYFNEPSFYYTGENGGTPRSMARIVVYMIIFVLIPFVACIAVFIFHVINHAKSAHGSTVTALSLVIVVLAQALLCVSMIIFPATYNLASWAWNFRHGPGLTNYLVIVLSFHGIADAICTIYCVMPYRRYVVSLFTRKKKDVTIHVSTTSARRFRNSVT
uniref:G-protein coupled receptors family 1 profile domain-containing protein n=1 Tax=Panagrellus redivivus TaxID=6233 RepID=A0A7E4W5H8_PANRE